MTADNLVLEHLRLLRNDIADLSRRVENLAAETRGVKGHVATLVQSDLHRDDRIAAVEVEIDRIKKRLELVD
jgi:hypothetical protein